MGTTFLVVWATFATIGFGVMLLWNFAHPYPLIQIPEFGHRLFGVPKEYHDAMVRQLQRDGLEPFGTFTAGVRQTLFRDGMTVIASGNGMQTSAISLPTENPAQSAQAARSYLLSQGIETILWEPNDPEFKGKICVVILPWGFGIAYRLPGRKMPLPKWE